MAKDPDHIYVLESKCGKCKYTVSKVGITSDPVRRIFQLQSGNPSRLIVVFVFKVMGDTARSLEARIKNELRSHKHAEVRHSREWLGMAGSEVKEATIEISKALSISLEHLDLSDFAYFPSPDECRRARNKLKWSIDYLATQAGVGESTISNYENSRTDSLQSATMRGIRCAFHLAGVDFEENDKTQFD